MKYLKRYESFLIETTKKINKNIDSSLVLVEKQVLGDFSDSFWSLSLRSSVFTKEEKDFIKENLLSYKVDLLNEGWFSDMVTKVWDTAKEKGGKIFDVVKEKISQIKNNIMKLVGGVTDFVKGLINSLIKLSQDKIKPAVDKARDMVIKKTKETMNSITQKHEEGKLTEEANQLASTYGFIKSKLTNSMASALDGGDSSTKGPTGDGKGPDDSVIAGLEGDIKEIESELNLNESVDILKSFYIFEANEVRYKEGDFVKYKRDNGEEVEKEIIRVEGDKYFFNDKDGNEFSKSIEDILQKAEKKDKSILSKAKDWFMKWFLDMEKSSPPEEGKAKWWIKLILKIIGLILSPIVKTMEVAIKTAAKNILKLSSIVCKKLNGPGVFEFLIMGGIVAGIPALVIELTLVSHKMPEPWAHIFEVVSHFLTEVSGLKVLLTVFGAFCATMTFHQLLTEMTHSGVFKGSPKIQSALEKIFGGHGDHGHGDTGDETVPAH